MEKIVKTGPCFNILFQTLTNPIKDMDNKILNQMLMPLLVT